MDCCVVDGVVSMRIARFRQTEPESCYPAEGKRVSAITAVTTELPWFIQSQSIYFQEVYVLFRPSSPNKFVEVGIHVRTA
jgi:hypothetical protein